jgi:hypothetical protein
MPSRLKRYQQSRQLHYVTFTCYHRRQYLGSGSARDVFEQTLERIRHQKTSRLSPSVPRSEFPGSRQPNSRFWKFAPQKTDTSSPDYLR